MVKQTPDDWETLTGGVPAGSEPIRANIDRYWQLPEYTREFLGRLTHDDIDLIVGTLRTVQAFGTVGRFLKRVGLLFAGGVIAAVAMGKDVGSAINTLLGWFHR